MRYVDRYDAVLLDLDGVVWRGETPIEGSPEAIEELRSLGKRVVFVSNNAARSPRDFAAKLMRMRMPTEPADVITAANAVVECLRGILQRGARVHVCGTDALTRFIGASGFAVTRTDTDVDALVVAWNPDLVMDDLRRAADVARSGVPFIGANRDATYPEEDGLIPGSGSILAAIETASGATATIVGKPQPLLFELALQRGGAPLERTLFVGDRPDSDVAGARGVGMPVVLVTTGVTGAEEGFDPPADAVFADLRSVVVAVDEPRAVPSPAEGDDQDEAGDEPADVGPERDAAPTLFDP